MNQVFAVVQENKSGEKLLAHRNRVASSKSIGVLLLLMVSGLALYTLLDSGMRTASDEGGL